MKEINEEIMAELEVRVNTEHQKDIAAIKRVLRLIRKNGLKPQSISQPTAANFHVPMPSRITPLVAMPNGNQKGEELENQILSTVENFHGKFTFTDLMQALKEKHSKEFDRKLVSGVIFQNKGKRIRVIQEGWGRRKAIYSKMSYMTKSDNEH